MDGAEQGIPAEDVFVLLVLTLESLCTGTYSVCERADVIRGHENQRTFYRSVYEE